MLCYLILPHSPQKNLDTIWATITAYYSSRGVATPYTNLSLNFFSEPKSPWAHYPKLAGRGAEIKDIVAPLEATWALHVGTAKLKIGEDATQGVSAALGHLLNMQDILSTHADDTFLPRRVAKTFQSETLSFLQRYSLLCNWADDAKLLLFSMVPKFHWLFHLADRAFWLNPRRGNTFIDEDFVGRMKSIVASCANGTAAHLVPTRFFEKYIWGMHLLFQFGLR